LLSRGHCSGAYRSLSVAGGGGQLPPQVIDGWEQFSLVCLDDIEVIAGRADWEEAVFHL